MRIYVLAFVLTAVAVSIPAATNWTRFRGPNGSGVAPTETGIPTKFGPEENVVWKTPIPPGNSSPVFGDDSIFVTGYEGDSLFTIAMDRSTGQVKWRRKLERTREGQLRDPNSPASPSPVTDGQNVYVFFQDIGLLGYGPDGNELWRIPLGPFNNPMGLGASPVLVNGKIIQVCDSETDSFILAVDKESGEVVWREDRPYSLRGFSTPVLWEPPDGGPQLLIAGSYELKAYNPDSGEVIWFTRSLTWQLKPTPVLDDDTAYVLGWAGNADLGQQEDVPGFEQVLADNDANGDGKLQKEETTNLDEHIGRSWDSFDLDLSGALEARDWAHHQRKKSVVNAVQALRLGGKGDMSSTAVKWRHYKSLPNVPSPLLYGDIVYLLKDGAIFTALDKETGEVLKQGRLSGAMGRYFASPVAADGKIYTASEEGVVTVVKPGAEWEPLQYNEMNEAIWSTPTIVDGKLYVRTESALYCFDE